MSEILEYVKKYIGTKELLQSFIEQHSFTQKEKQALQWAFLELNKDRPNMMFIEDANKVIAKVNNRRKNEQKHSNDDVIEDNTISTVKFCSHCGAELEENAKFCSKCGAPVVHQEKIQSNNNYSQIMNEMKQSTIKGKNKSSKSRSVWSILAILMVVVSVFYLIADYNTFSTDVDKYAKYSQREFGLSGRDALNFGREVKTFQDEWNGNDGSGIFIALIFLAIGIFIFAISKWKVPQEKIRLYEEERKVKLASFSKRFMATFIDIFIPLMLFVFLQSKTSPESSSDILRFIPYLLLIFIMYNLFKSNGTGQSFGYKIMNLQVVSENPEEPVTFKHGVL